MHSTSSFFLSYLLDPEKEDRLKGMRSYKLFELEAKNAICCISSRIGCILKSYYSVLDVYLNPLRAGNLAKYKRKSIHTPIHT